MLIRLPKFDNSTCMCASLALQQVSSEHSQTVEIDSKLLSKVQSVGLAWGGATTNKFSPTLEQ